MAREWTERHIIELIKRNGGGVGGGVSFNGRRVLIPHNIPTASGFGVSYTSSTTIAEDMSSRRNDPVLFVTGIREQYIPVGGNTLVTDISRAGGSSHLPRPPAHDTRAHVFMPIDPPGFGVSDVLYHRMIPTFGHVTYTNQTVEFVGEDYRNVAVHINYPSGDEMSSFVDYALTDDRRTQTAYSLMVGLNPPSSGDENYWAFTDRLSQEHTWGSALSVADGGGTSGALQTMFALLSGFMYGKSMANDTSSSTINTRQYGFTLI